MRTANSLAAMASPALEMQYSPRLIEATVAEIEVMKTMEPENAASARFCSAIQLPAAWVRK